MPEYRYRRYADVHCKILPSNVVDPSRNFLPDPEYNILNQGSPLRNEFEYTMKKNLKHLFQKKTLKSLSTKQDLEPAPKLPYKSDPESNPKHSDPQP